MNNRLKLLLAFSATMLHFCHSFASHNPSRYFPFFERPETYQDRDRSHVSSGFFFTTASSGFNDGGGTIGIPELWGPYDLRDIIKSTEKTLGSNFNNPLTSFTNYNFCGKGYDLSTFSLPFHVKSKVEAEGLVFSGLYKTNFHGLSVGFWTPLMHVRTKTRFTLNRRAMGKILGRDVEDNEDAFNSLEDTVDGARRSIHNQIGLCINDWVKTDLGDLDLFARWSRIYHYCLLCRSISFNLQAGVLAPTGAKNSPKYHASIPFMGNGHWGFYFDFAPEFELKEDLKFGFILAGVHQFTRTHRMRTPVFKEPAPFSPLLNSVSIEPGGTFKFSPYIAFENMRDGLHGQLRYTYLRHGKDRWTSKNKNQSCQNFLCIQPFDDVTIEDIQENADSKIKMTKWRSHYLTFQLTYNSKDGGWHWWGNPNVYLTYDMPLSGANICKTHQVTVGVELHI